MDITSRSKGRGALGMPGDAVEVGGVRLSVSDPGGVGIPIVCLHAAGHGSADFGALRQRVGGSVRVITVDWPGHGRSGHDRVAADAKRYTELVLGLLEILALPRVVLLGCSVGGAVALRVAAVRPDLVSGLVLCNAGGLAAPGAFIRVFCGVMAWAYRRGAAGAWWFPTFFALKYRVLLRGAATDHRRRIVAAGRAHAGVLAELWASFATPANDLRASIDEVRCPVWLAWARSDPFNNHRMIAAALRRFDVPVECFAGGHAPFIEQPDAFADGLLGFLARSGLQGGDRATRGCPAVAPFCRTGDNHPQHRHVCPSRPASAP